MKRLSIPARGAALSAAWLLASGCSAAGDASNANATAGVSSQPRTQASNLDVLQCNITVTPRGALLDGALVTPSSRMPDGVVANGACTEEQARTWAAAVEATTGVRPRMARVICVGEPTGSSRGACVAVTLAPSTPSAS